MTAGQQWGLFWPWVLLLVCSAFIMDPGISKGGYFMNVLTKERTDNCLGERGFTDACALEN